VSSWLLGKFLFTCLLLLFEFVSIVLFFCQEREPSQIEIEYNHRMNGIHKETACLQTLTREQQRIELDIMLSFA
jgi:hypothetical protein